MQEMVDELRRRQAAREVAADLHACYLLLTLFAAGSAPVMLPGMLLSIGLSIS